MSEENTVRFSLADAGRGKTDWEYLRNMTEEEIEANALSDPDNPPLTAEQLAAAVPVRPGDPCRTLRQHR
jgi:hypothetical protein